MIFKVFPVFSYIVINNLPRRRNEGNAQVGHHVGCHIILHGVDIQFAPVGNEIAKLVVVALQLDVQQFAFVGFFALILKRDEADGKNEEKDKDRKKQPLAEREDTIRKFSHNKVSG